MDRCPFIYSNARNRARGLGSLPVALEARVSVRREGRAVRPGATAASVLSPRSRCRCSSGGLAGTMPAEIPGPAATGAVDTG